MKTTTRLLIALIVAIISAVPASAQTLKVAAGNTLMGTGNGTLLGLSVMGLKNDANLDPIRVGIGAGTIMGLGVGVYDVSRMDGLGYYQVEGLFNTTDYTGLIILMDTFYGGVTGAVLGMAVSLMTGDQIVKGLQYGGSVGVIAGFGFGLVDAFYFSSSSATFSHLGGSDSGDYLAIGVPPAHNFHGGIAGSQRRYVDGLVKVTSGENIAIGLIQPVLLQNPISQFSPGEQRSMTSGMQVAHLRINF